MNHTVLLNSVLDDYLAFRENALTQSIDLFGQVVQDWISATERIAAQNQEYGSSFNPFTRINIGETSHSRLLGDLLNPHGSHGQGSLFLDVFLGKLGLPILESHQWNTTVEIGRVDIFIWRNQPKRTVIIIENKSNDASDQMNQIYRYWHEKMYVWDRDLWDATAQATIDERNLRFHLVYLPTDGGRSPANHTLERPQDWTLADNPHPRVPLECQTLSLPELTESWLRLALPQIPITNTRLRDFLNQYRELWKS